MKFILAAIATFLLFSIAYGQTTATTADDKINAEIDQLFKDAETDFAPIRGDVASRTADEIIYKTTKNYFQSAGFTTTLKFYNDARIDELQLSGSGKSAEKVFNFVKEKFKSTADIKSSSDSDEFLFKGQRIAQLMKQGGKFYLWFYSNRSAWQAFNEFHDNDKFFDKALLDFKMDAKAIKELNDYINSAEGQKNINNVLNGTYEDSLKQCKKNIADKQYKQAIESCTNAIKSNDKSLEAYIARGNAYLNTPDEKERDSKELTKQNSIGINEESAEKDFIKVTELDPKSSDNFVMLAEVQMKIYVALYYDDVIANLEKARQLNPNNAKIYYDLGEAWREFTDGDYTKVSEYRDRAITNYTKYISLKPNDYNGYLGRGLTYFARNKNEEAVADLTKYIQSGQMNDEAFSARGQSYLELEKYSQAIDDLTKAIKIHVFKPKYTGETDDLKHDVYWSRAEAYKALGKNKEACQDLEVIGEECN
jgi:hypothetical protein